MDSTQNLTTRPIMGKLSLNGILAMAGIAGPVILVLADYTAVFSAPQYNLIRDSISSLAWTRMGWIQTIGFLAIGLLVELFVAGLFFSIRGYRGYGFGLAILVLFGFGLLLIGAFHTDPVNGPNTIEGIIHGVVAKTIFWLFPIASLLIAPSLKRDTYWKPLFAYSIGAAAFSVVIMIVIALIPEEKGYFGLLERLLVADEIIWVETVAIWLLRLSFRVRNN